MTYIGLNKVPIAAGSLTKISRDICFVLTDPGKWDTNVFLKILWEMAGGIIDTITLYSTYKNPETDELSHTYEIVFNCGPSHSKVGFAFSCDRDTVTELVGKIEDEIESKMNVRIRGRHTLSDKRN
jgi:hypothetical protein